MNSPVRWVCAFVGAVVLMARCALGTTVVPPTFEQLVAQAELVVRAEVSALRCEETAREGQAVIHTYVTLTILRALKGEPPATVELRLLGGTVGDRTLHVSGVPRFVPGERCLLFIENNGRQFCPLVAIMHGRYRVERRAADGVEVVRRDNGAPLRSPSDVALPMAAPIPALSPGAAMTLDEFESAILNQLSHDTAAPNQ
jgi:hypothetical protein